jgi:hypothetical protein
MQKRKLANISLSAMCSKVKNKINDLGKGSIGTSTLKNFYKRKTNPNTKPKTLKLVASWVENKKRDYDEEDCEK